MPVKVLQFADRKPKDRNWSNAELAELYRVEHALVQAGIALETACGMSDEGDPWYVFCRRQGDVLVHITRYDGFYHLYSPALHQPLTGVSFSALTKSFVSGLRTPVVHNAKCRHSSCSAVERCCCGHLLCLRFSFPFSEGGARIGARGAIFAFSARLPDKRCVEPHLPRQCHGVLQSSRGSGWLRIGKGGGGCHLGCFRRCRLGGLRLFECRRFRGGPCRRRRCRRASRSRHGPTRGR